MESVRHELAPFDISVTIVEPGSARTEFVAALAHATPLAVYDSGPVGETRRYFTGAPPPPPGDPVKMARAIIASAAQRPAPLRLALGSDAYAAIKRALIERLAELERDEPLARSTDA